MVVTRKLLKAITKVLEEHEGPKCDKCALTDEISKYTLRRLERQRLALKGVRSRLNQIQRLARKLVLVDLDTNFETRAELLRRIKWARSDTKDGARI